VHLQTLSWRPLSKQSRDKKLIALGIAAAVLSELRALEPRQRIIKGAQIALEIDEEPNADLIDYIAGYRARSRVYYYFRNMKELMEVARLGRKTASLKAIEPKPSEIDLAFTIPSVFQNYPVHVETSRDPGMFVVWQKVNGGMRLVSISRSISRIGFWSGVLLYVTEGTKFSKANSNVEIANARPEVLRLFLAFLEEMGLPRYRVRARIQLHSLAEKKRAQSYWDGEIGFASQPIQ